MHTMIPNEAILVVTSLCMQTRMQKNKKHILWSHDEVFFAHNAEQIELEK